MSKAAIFWDRDGTLIQDPGYLSDPEQVELLPGAVEAVRRLGEAGFENIIVTNQSGVARGLVDEPTVERIHERLRDKLAEGGAAIDAVYYCPYLDGDEALVEAYRRDSDLRKPQPGMLLKAAAERDIDLQASWSIGDSVRDAKAGRAAGCRTILLRSEEAKPSARRAGVDFTAGSLARAVDIVLRYRPNHTNMPGRTEAVGAAREVAGKMDTEQIDDAHGDRGKAAGSDQPGASEGAPEQPGGAEGVSERPGEAKGAERPAAPDTAPILQEILALLRVMDRRARTEEFSLAGLTGAILQVVALAALVWAVFAYLWNEPLGIQLVRLGFALLLQLLALTFFVLGSRK
jgi:D-glycero-D-manno-heptose 1,7-bisphosphate phosphatase